VGATAGGAVMMGKAAIGDVGNVWDPNAPEHEQIETLRQELLGLEGRVNKFGQETRQQTGAVRAELQGAIARVRAEVTEIDRRLKAEAVQDARLDARTLWLVGLGIVMTGFPDGLATWTWSGILTLVVAGAITVAVVVGIVIGGWLRVSRAARTASPEQA